MNAITQFSEKQIRKARAAKDERDRFFQLSLDMLCIIGYDGYLKDANPAVENILGFTIDELKSKPALEFTHPQDVEMAARELEKLIRGQNTHYIEMRLMRKDGSYRWTSWSAYSDKEDQLIYTIGRDITEQKSAQEELFKTQQKFKLLVQNVTDYAIYMLDPEGCVISWNAGAERLIGYREDEILGKHFSIFFSKEDIECGKPQKLMEDARLRRNATDEGWRVRKNGSTFWGDSAISAISDENGNLLGFGKVTQDLTRMIALEQMKKDLVTFAAHQLKTPVAETHGYVSNMLMGLTGDLNEKQRHYLHQLKEINSRSVRLIENLLFVSQIERKAILPDTEPVDLKEIVDYAMRNHIEPFKRKGTALRVKENKTGVKVLADIYKAVEAIGNVIDNAGKFASGGNVTVEIEESNRFGIVRVKDSGPGIPENIAPKLFTKDLIFSGPRPKGGSGLGLYIADNFMKLQNGSISVESFPEKGSEFTFRFPIHEKG